MQTTDRGAIESRVVHVIRNRFGDAASSLAGDAELVDALPGFDSLAALELITAIETEFDIEVDFVTDDIRFSFSTVNRIADYVRDTVEDRAG